MTRRKSEIVRLRNERDFPYLVELALPPGGPGKSAIDAVGTARQRCWRYDWVLDLDIKAYFDNTVASAWRSSFRAPISRSKILISWRLAGAPINPRFEFANWPIGVCAAVASPEHTACAPLRALSPLATSPA